VPFAATRLQTCRRGQLPSAQIFSQRLAENAIPALHCVQLLRFCVTSLNSEILTLGQLYRDRADCENAFDAADNASNRGL
jgi:hypothetical protein